MNAKIIIKMKNENNNVIFAVTRHFHINCLPKEQKKTTEKCLKIVVTIQCGVRIELHIAKNLFCLWFGMVVGLEKQQVSFWSYIYSM